MAGVNSLDAFMDSVNRATQLFDQFGNTIQNNTDNIITREQVEARIKQEQEKAAQKYAKLSTAIVSTAQAMTTQEGAFNQLGNITATVVKAMTSMAGGLPVFGAAIKGIGEGAGEAIKFITQQSGQAFATFGKISGSGIVRSFEDMREAAKKTGLLYEEMDMVLAKNSESLAMFGKTAGDGSSKMQDILFANRKFAEQAQQIGISFAEFSEMQASYVAQQIRTGGIRNKTEKDLADGARRYSEELDTLSKLTGKQRNELQKQQEKMLSDARYRAKMQELEAVDPAAAQRMRNMITMMPAELQEGLKDTFSAGGNITSKASAELAVQLSQGGQDMAQMVRDVLEGRKDEKEAFTETAEAAKKYVESTGQIAGLIGKESALTSNFTALSDLAGHAGKSFKEITTDIEKNREAQKKQTDDYAKAATTAHQLASSIQLFSTSANYVIKINNMVGGSLLELAKLINKITGKNTTGVDGSGLGATSGEMSSAIKYSGAASGAYAGLKAGATIGTLFGGPIGTAIGAGVGAVGGAAVGYFLGNKFANAAGYNEASNSSTSNPSNIDQILKFNEKDSGSRQHFDKLDDAFKKRVIAAAEEYFLLTGKPFTVNSSYRSLAEQQALWDESVKEKRPGRGPTGMEIADPSKGPSAHNRGMAIDIQEYRDPMALMALERQGLRQTRGEKDPVHFQMRNGGIVAPSSGGSIINIAEAGQAEAVVPLPDGKSIPVAFNSNTDQSGIIKLFQSMNEKFDTMIDLLESSNSTQRNIAQNLA
jgi:hypothetical protein